MKSSIEFFYLLVLSFWIGGMSIFTFVVTPAIFRSFSRDRAGEIVDKLFPGYFIWDLVLSGLALVFFFLLDANKPSAPYQWSLGLINAALLANTYVNIKLHPRILRIKREVTSFEREPADSPARKEFRKLHAISAIVNIGVLLDGIALLALSRSLFR